MKTLLATFLSCFFTAAAPAALTVGGVYDENTVSANVVDRSAGFVGGEGPGNDEGLIMDVRAFAAAVATAAESGFGGVVDFESGTLDTATSFTILFNGGTKSLVLREDTSSGYYIKSYVADNRTPISGTRALAKEAGSASFEFRIASVNGGKTGEQVVAVGATVLGRNGSNARSQWSGVVTIQDQRGHTGTITNRVSNLNTGNGNATDDAFFGFRAPKDYFITDFLILSDSGAFTSVDDLAFVTAVPAEPAAVKPTTAPPPAAGSATKSSAAQPGMATGGFGPEWWIVGALAVIIVLLIAVIWTLKRVTQTSALLPARASSTVVSEARVEAPSIKQPELPPGKIPAELTEFAKQSLVQGLYSQRQALIETQKQAQQRLVELEEWLSQLHLPLQDRIRTYERRIQVLEKELVSKDESVRELTRATLLLVRQKLEEEKERERSQTRFS